MKQFLQFSTSYVIDSTINYIARLKLEMMHIIHLPTALMLHLLHLQILQLPVEILTDIMIKAQHGEQFFIARAAFTLTCKHFRNVYKENVEKKFCNEVISSCSAIKRCIYMVNTLHTFQMCLCEASCFVPTIIADIREKHKFTESDSIRFFFL